MNVNLSMPYTFKLSKSRRQRIALDKISPLVIRPIFSTKPPSAINSLSSSDSVEFVFIHNNLNPQITEIAYYQQLYHHKYK